MRTAVTVTLTLAELIELRRALDLICNADEDADVNIDARSRAAKASATRKLDDAFNAFDRKRND